MPQQILETYYQTSDDAYRPIYLKDTSEPDAVRGAVRDMTSLLKEDWKFRFQPHVVATNVA
jgi:hypothetical protein